jgi:hypothetical protein
LDDRRRLAGGRAHPEHNTALALTFWTLVVWYDLLVEA